MLPPSPPANSTSLTSWNMPIFCLYLTLTIYCDLQEQANYECWQENCGKYAGVILSIVSQGYFARCHQPLWLERQQLTVSISSTTSFHSLICSLSSWFLSFPWTYKVQFHPICRMNRTQFHPEVVQVIQITLQHEPKLRKWELLWDMLWEHLQNWL